MITVSQVMAAISQHQTGLPPGAVSRWAFLVTMEEIASLVDEIQASPQLGLQMDPVHAQHVREGRAMLHINCTAVLPELIEVPSNARLDG